MRHHTNTYEAFEYFKNLGHTVSLTKLKNPTRRIITLDWKGATIGNVDRLDGDLTPARIVALQRCFAWRMVRREIERASKNEDVSITLVIFNWLRSESIFTKPRVGIYIDDVADIVDKYRELGYRVDVRPLEYIDDDVNSFIEIDWSHANQ